MATSTQAQVPSTAVDSEGLSNATTVRSLTDHTHGTLYDNTVMAAAAPIHFHAVHSPSLGGDIFLMLNSQRWSAATPSSTDPGFYSAYTADTTPSWFRVVASGSKTAINGDPSIPMRTPNTARTLIGAVSRATFLWTLLAVTNGSVHSAVIQHWHYNDAIGTVNIIDEETLPTATNGADTVLFNVGVEYSMSTDPYIQVYGAGSSTHQVYRARKRWSRVGNVGVPNAPVDAQWEFFTGSGWSYDPTAARPLTGTLGPLTTYGPMSFAHYARVGSTSRQFSGHHYLVTTNNASGVMTAQVWDSVGGRPLAPVGAPVALGTVGSTYAGGTMQLQTQLGINQSQVLSGNVSAIPYLISTLVTSGGNSQISVVWNCLQVPRLS